MGWSSKSPRMGNCFQRGKPQWHFGIPGVPHGSTWFHRALPGSEIQMFDHHSYDVVYSVPEFAHLGYGSGIKRGSQQLGKMGGQWFEHRDCSVSCLKCSRRGIGEWVSLQPFTDHVVRSQIVSTSWFLYKPTSHPSSSSTIHQPSFWIICLSNLVVDQEMCNWIPWQFYVICSCRHLTRCPDRIARWAHNEQPCLPLCSFSRCKSHRHPQTASQAEKEHTKYKNAFKMCHLRSGTGDGRPSQQAIQFPVSRKCNEQPSCVFCLAGHDPVETWPCTMYQFRLQLQTTLQAGNPPWSISKSPHDSQLNQRVPCCVIADLGPRWTEQGPFACHVPPTRCMPRCVHLIPTRRGLTVCQMARNSTVLSSWRKFGSKYEKNKKHKKTSNFVYFNVAKTWESIGNHPRVWCSNILIGKT